MASYSDPDTRFSALKQFIAEHFGRDVADIAPASADASFRRYWRAQHEGRSYIVMDAPPEKEDISPWLDVNRRLADKGLHVPEVHAVDLGQGFILMADLGNELYLPALDAMSVDGLYDQAMSALLAMQVGVDAQGLPDYDEVRLRQELDLMPEWFLKQHLGVAPNAEDRSAIEECFRLLVASALEQPRCFVHRDFHSRNLLIVERDSPGIVDFQDAVRGPISYDLVSLLRDCYIEWPVARVTGWSMQYKSRLAQSGLLTPTQEKNWQRWFDWMGLQRHIKVLGIFCRLCYRDGKQGYLGDLPLVLKYVLNVAAAYAELRPFADRLRAMAGSIDLTYPRRRSALDEARAES